MFYSIKLKERKKFRKYILYLLRNLKTFYNMEMKTAVLITEHTDLYWRGFSRVWNIWRCVKKKLKTNGTMALINQKAYRIVFLLFNLLQKPSGTTGVKTHSLQILMSRKKKKKKRFVDKKFKQVSNKKKVTTSFLHIL